MEDNLENPTATSDELTLSSFITYTNTVDTSADTPAIRARNAKYQLLSLTKLYTSLLGIDSCSEVVRIWNPSNTSHERIIRRGCGNRHACPVCTSKFMAQKRKLNSNLMRTHRSNGGEIFQSVLNQAIKPNTPLQESLPLLNKAWVEMTKSMAWRKLCQEYGLYGYVRVQEEAFRANSWFPHFHCIWFFEGQPDSSRMLEFSTKAAEIWAYYSKQVGSKRTTAASQQHESIKLGSENSEAWYLFKHGYLDLDFDPSQVDLGKQSLTPFNLLTYALITADADLMEKWNDFEQATQGTRRVNLSANLSKLAKSVI